jgi:hypothetical protein
MPSSENLTGELFRVYIKALRLEARIYDPLPAVSGGCCEMSQLTAR